MNEIDNSRVIDRYDEYAFQIYRPYSVLNPNFVRSITFCVTERCNMACNYCVSGETMIRMADMTEKPIMDIKVGDSLMAFDEFPEDSQKKQSSTREAKVTQVFHRKAKVLELTFEDGTILHITDEHPILVRRNAYEGHKYDFRPAGKIKPGRMVYCLSNRMNGVYETPDIYDNDYILGYITGMTLGDGSLKDYRDRKQGVFFRIAVKDEEILERFGKYLDILGIEYKTRNFQISKRENKWIDAICSGKLSVYEAIKNIIDSNFRVNKSVNYYKGFLASIYDAEGHIDKVSRIIRICNTDYNIIQEICDGLDAIGVKWILEESGRTVNFDKKWNVRIVMGESLESYKFVKLVSPAVPRKGVENFTRYQLGRTKLVSARVAEELGEIDVYNLETTTHTYFANNIAVHNCYEINKTNKSMSKEVGKQIVDYLFKEYENPSSTLYKCQVPILGFIGGEPLIELELIEYILDYFWSRAIQEDHIWALTWKCNITTNGTLWFENGMDRFMNKFGKNRMSVTITVDGYKELHNSCRVYKDGRGTYDDVYSAVEDYYKNFVMSRHDTKVTIAPENLPYLKNSMDYFIEEGYNVIYANTVFEADWKIDDAKLFYESLIYISDRLRESDPDIFVSLFERHDFFKLPEDFNENYCGGTGKMIAFDVDGNIYPCLRYMGLSLGNSVPPYIVGNVYDGMCHTETEKNRWEYLDTITRRSQSTDECFSCPIGSGCAWCSAYNYQLFGTPNKRATKTCIMHKTRALANSYHWNMLYLEKGIGVPFESNIPDEWALEIISKEELNKLKEIEAKAFDKYNAKA